MAVPTEYRCCRRSPAASARGDALVAELERLRAERSATAPAAGHHVSPVRGVVGLPNYVRAGRRPGLGAGRRRRLPPRPDHRARHHRRLPRRRAAGERGRRRSLRDPARRASALAGYQSARATAALRETFELTRALTPFPPPTRFVELQIQLSDALDREARHARLASGTPRHRGRTRSLTHTNHRKEPPCPSPDRQRSTASTPPRCSPPSTPSGPSRSWPDFQFRVSQRWVSGTHNRGHDQRLLRRRAGAPARARRPSSTPTTRLSSSAPTRARRRPS